MERAKEKEGWLDYKRENDTISKCNNEAFGEGGNKEQTKMSWEEEMGGGLSFGEKTIHFESTDEKGSGE